MRVNKKLLSNFTYLTILEIFILLAPFITYPYLVHVLGTELYGWVITAQITASYFTILIDFGFKRISARHITNNINNRTKINEIISSILTIRIILWAVSFIIYLLVISIIGSYREQFLLFFFSFFTTLSSVLFLDFYYQGIEDMRYITISNIIVRSIFIALTFIVINEASDYIYVPLIWSIGYIIGGVLSIWIAFFKHRISFCPPHWTSLKKHLKEGSIIFASDAMISIKDKLNYNLMGMIIGMSDIIIYDIGSKISSLLQKPTSILCSVIFPTMVKLKSIDYAQKCMLVLFCLSTVLVLIINAFLPYIVHFFIDETVDLMAIRLYTLAPIILSISIFISINIFFAFGYERWVLKSTYVTTFGYILILIITYFCGLLNSVTAFVLLTLSAYFIELCYRLIICNTIFTEIKNNTH